MLADQLAFELDYFSGMSDLYNYLCMQDDSFSLFRECHRIFDDLEGCWHQQSKFYASLDSFTCLSIEDQYHLNTWC
jgi:hypothetical protein